MEELTDVPTGVRTLSVRAFDTPNFYDPNAVQDLIAFNIANADRELHPPYDDQSRLRFSSHLCVVFHSDIVFSRLISAESRNGKDETYLSALADIHDAGRTRGIDAALKEYNLDALVLPTIGFVSTAAGNYIYASPTERTIIFLAIAGYPIVTVPLGFYSDDVTIQSVGPTTFYPAPGIPYGLSFFSTAYSEFELIGLAYAFEQATHVRLKRKAYDAAIPKTQLKDVISDFADASSLSPKLS